MFNPGLPSRDTHGANGSGFPERDWEKRGSNAARRWITAGIAMLIVAAGVWFLIEPHGYRDAASATITPTASDGDAGCTAALTAVYGYSAAVKAAHGNRVAETAAIAMAIKGLDVAATIENDEETATDIEAMAAVFRQMSSAGQPETPSPGDGLTDGMIHATIALAEDCR
jgi:hypothetical protein